MTAEQTRLYGDVIRSAVASQSAFLKHALSADRAGSKVAKIATIIRPRTRYTLGLDAAIVIPLNRILPTRLMDRIFATTF